MSLTDIIIKSIMKDAKSKELSSAQKMKLSVRLLQKKRGGAHAQ